MHILVCFPFLDLRSLIEQGSSPGWLFGDFTSVGALGRVVHALGNGVDAEIRANAALAFPDEYNRSQRSRSRRRLKPADIDNGLTVAGRRLLADGVGQVRLELLAHDVRQGGLTLEDRLDQLMTTPVYVVREGQTELISAGFYAAHSYLVQSEKTNPAPETDINTRLLREGAGSPFIVVIHPQPADGQPVGTRLETAPARFDAVTCRLVELAGRVTGVWQIWGAGPQLSWLEPVRMLCRVICQLSEVRTLIGLQQDPTALAPHLLDDDKLDHFLRIRGGQLRRPKQGDWPVHEVQKLAKQHLKASIDDETLTTDSLAAFMRRDIAGEIAQSMNRMEKGSNEQVMLKPADRDLLVDMLTVQALNAQDYFRRLIMQAALPQPFKVQRQNNWSNQPQLDAMALVDWALSKGRNPARVEEHVLASILLPELKNLGLEDAWTTVAVISAYGLIYDEAQLTALRVRYNCPAPTAAVAAHDVGPEIVWRGPADEIELQSWLNRAPPEFLDVAYLRRAISHAGSVCRVDVAASGEKGTGFVVHEQFVLTNYHVVKSVMLADKPAPEANSIRLRFGAGKGEDAEYCDIAVDGADPIVAWSPTEKLDYALLRVPDLAKFPDIRPVKRAAAPPPMRSPLNILQHPNGGDMKLAPSLDAVTFCDPDTGILQYVTKTANGSSGAPCFNDNWELVAVHHAERSRPFGTIREGVLIGAIEKEIGKWIN